VGEGIKVVNYAKFPTSPPGKTGEEEGGGGR